MREIIYSYLHGHPDYMDLPHKRQYKYLEDVLEEEDIHEIRCGSAPIASGFSTDIFESGGPYSYVDCEGQGRMLIKRNKGKIVEIGCLNTKEIARKEIFNKKEHFCWLLKKKVWEVVESFIMYVPEKDVLPCSVMYTVVNKEVQS